MNSRWTKGLILGGTLTLGGAFVFFTLEGVPYSYFQKQSDNPQSCDCAETSKNSAILATLTGPLPEGMVLIPSGTFRMGGNNSEAKQDEFPLHEVRLDSFFMDETEVTNEQFEKFVTETGYTTTAEKAVDWELLKLQVPPGTPKPPAEKLAPGSVVFTPPSHAVPLNDHSQWWSWTTGANWRRPLGATSQTFGGDHPVVHISWEDANAYCKGMGKRLPTEAEREWVARGGLEGKIFPWGNEVEGLQDKINIWEGSFPHQSTKKNPWTTPVKHYPPNEYGLYDMTGNVWEWTADLYDADYYARLSKNGTVENPHNREKSYDPDDPLTQKYVLRGGSFLCNKSYCTGYRVSARMKSSPDTSSVHVGFRCVKSESKKIE